MVDEKTAAARQGAKTARVAVPASSAAVTLPMREYLRACCCAGMNEKETQE
jgi:hypothetical protein